MMAAGRPTNYRPEYCEMVIPLLKEGMSIEEIGLELDVGYTTIYEWMDRHPEFAQAIKRGREFSKAWWLRNGRTQLENDKFSSTLWYMNMKNRFGWSDKKKWFKLLLFKRFLTDVVKEEEKGLLSEKESLQSQVDALQKQVTEMAGIVLVLANQLHELSEKIKRDDETTMSCARNSGVAFSFYQSIFPACNRSRIRHIQSS